MKRLNDRTDLTRWNRSGLSRFRYVDGNAITYLESLRQAMAQSFTDAGGNNQWQALDDTFPVSPDENPSERQKRWLDQYRDERRDYAWEIMRTFARASHVLTEHLDAYVNEGYIGTATQWNNVRRLVEMLDYHPAPPASAETFVALLAKEEKEGEVATGFAFKNKPDDGSEASVFETLADIDITPELNILYSKDWNKSQRNFEYIEIGGSYCAEFPLSAPLDEVAVGTMGVLLIALENSTMGVYVRVDSISESTLNLKGWEKPDAFPDTVLRHQVRLLLKPAFKQVPLMTGDNVVVLKYEHGLIIKDVVSWKTSGTWHAAYVEAVEGERVRLSRTAPAEGTKIYLATYTNATVRIDTPTSDDQDVVVIPSHSKSARFHGALWDEALGSISHGYNDHHRDPYSNQTLFDYVLADTYPKVYYVPLADDIAVVLSTNPQGFIIEGDSGKLAHEDWLIVQSAEGNKAAYITELDESDKTFELKLSTTISTAEILFGAFEIDVNPADYNVNLMPVFETDLEKRSDSHSILPLENIPEILTIGHTLIVAGQSDAHQVTVKDIDEDAGFIKVTPAIPGSELTASGTTDDYTRYHTMIYGNVVQAGHGETQNSKILGSGDATQPNQSFDFNVDDVSFISDSSFPSGVRAAITVSVDQRIWKQVATLNDSDPEDSHYVVRTQEDGTLNISFGDGRHGRRLTTGSNNVRIEYRVGIGLAANLSAYSLEKIVKPHALVDSIVQPIAASGGNEMEDVASLRENAPASLLTLQRAVSLVDFTHLAQANSSVWQARAIRLLPPGLGRSDMIEIVVVPAGGGELGLLADSLQDTLSQHALPGVQISISRYQSVILDLNIIIRTKTDEFDADLVAENVRQTLIDTFSLEQMKLGEPLYRSQVIEIIERVEGVENSDCMINNNGFYDENGVEIIPRRVVKGSGEVVKLISLDECQVIYLNEKRSELIITVQEYSL
ncbi:MAG: hypothetical protein OEX11_06985 [Nitrosomonas sp.]|nr:hypothetical protein [Nitrosomonas sp.]